MIRGVVIVSALCTLCGFVWPASASERAATHCLRALTPQAAGGLADSAGFAPASCPQTPVPVVFRYDRQRKATFVATAVARDQIVRSYVDFDAEMIEPGQTLRLVVSYCAARIEREVQAMQGARLGHRLFVRSADGTILSVRYEKAAP